MNSVGCLGRNPVRSGERNAVLSPDRSSGLSGAGRLGHYLPVRRGHCPDGCRPVYVHSCLVSCFRVSFGESLVVARNWGKRGQSRGGDASSERREMPCGAEAGTVPGSRTGPCEGTVPGSARHVADVSPSRRRVPNGDSPSERLRRTQRGTVPIWRYSPRFPRSCPARRRKPAGPSPPTLTRC
jgi:hypothetical protein